MLSWIIPSNRRKQLKLTDKAPGDNIPVYLLDGTCYYVRVTASTTIGAVCLSIKQALGMQDDSCYGLFENIGDAFTFLDDHLTLQTVIQDWNQPNFNGPRQFVYKRFVFSPEFEKALVGSSKVSSSSSSAYISTSSPQDPRFHLSFIETVYNFRTCRSRFSLMFSVKLASLLLQIFRGNYDPRRDTVEEYIAFLPWLIPSYCIRGNSAVQQSITQGAFGLMPTSGRRRSSVSSVSTGASSNVSTPSLLSSISSSVSSAVTQPSSTTTSDPSFGASSAGGSSRTSRRIGTASDALWPVDIAIKLLHSHAALSRVTFQQAEKEFLRFTKLAWPGFGGEFFFGKRTWKTSVSGNPSQVVDRIDDVCLCICNEGIMLSSMDTPEDVVPFEYQDISKWTVSSDGQIFAFTVLLYPSSNAVLPSSPFPISSNPSKSMSSLRSNSSSGSSTKRGLSASSSQKSLKSFPRFVSGRRLNSKRETIVPIEEIIYIVTEDADEIEKAIARYVGLKMYKMGITSGLPSGNLSFSSRTPASLPMDVPIPMWTGTQDPPLVPFMLPSAERTRAPYTGTVQLGSYQANFDASRHAGVSFPKSFNSANGFDSHVSLPTGWSYDYDPDGEIFYIHSKTGHTQWEKPEMEELPSGWSIDFDDSGDKYYVNDVTGDTQWEKPISPSQVPKELLIKAITSRSSIDSNVTSSPTIVSSTPTGDSNTKTPTSTSVTIILQPLPPGWVQDEDETGTPFYANDDTGEQSWFRPYIDKKTGRVIIPTS
jgi:WW domain